LGLFQQNPSKADIDTRIIQNELRRDGVLFQLASEDHVSVLRQLFDALSRGSVQSNARTKAEFAPCLLRGGR